MAAVELFLRLRALGVELSIDVDGRLAYDAPADALADDVIEGMRARRDELLALVRGRLDQESAVSRGPGLLCPWCRLGDRLGDDPEGLRCDRCGRLAWRMVGDSIERVDYVELLPITPPIKQASPSAGNGCAVREAKAVQSRLSWGE
jgi:hypothetical protein